MRTKNKVGLALWALILFLLWLGWSFGRIEWRNHKGIYPKPGLYASGDNASEGHYLYKVKDDGSIDSEIKHYKEIPMPPRFWVRSDKMIYFYVPRNGKGVWLEDRHIH